MPDRPDDRCNAWFSLLGDLAGVGLWELDARTGAISNVGGLDDILGLPPGAAPDRAEGLIPFIHPDDREAFRAKLRAITSVAQDDSSMRLRLVRPDGRTVHVLSRSCCAAQDAAGRPLLIRGVVRDVDDVMLYRERVLAIAGEVGRHHGTETLAALVQSLGGSLGADVCIIARLDRGHAMCRRSAAWGPDGIELPTTWPIAGSPFAAIRSGSAVAFADGLQLAFPGHVLFQAASAQGFIGVPLFGSDGAVNGCLAVLVARPLREDPDAVRDVLAVFASRAGAELARQDVAKDLDKTQVRLHQAEKMDALGRLAGGIAHDFNNMLAGIMGATELLSARLGLDSPHQRLVRTIMQSAERSAELTRKLLSFSRKAPVQRRQHDLRAPVEEALAILERSIDRHIAVRRDLGAAPLAVAGDPGLLQAMALNLCLNACDAMPRGGTLTVALAQVRDDDAAGWDLPPGRYVQLTVGDTGVGMDEATAARLFEPFFSTKAPGAGAGLGLAAAYGTVQEHGGSIQVDTAPGRGTTVRVRLPLLATAAAEVGAARQPGRGAATGRILLVDDEDLVRQATGELLASLGWQVVHARDGEEGIRRFAEDPSSFALAVLDSIMPRLDGLGCFRGLREIRGDLPVVFCSGYTRDRTRTELPGEPRVAFVQKPFRLAEMVQAIQSIRQP